jgi:hypothetical protein
VTRARALCLPVERSVVADANDIGAGRPVADGGAVTVDVDDWAALREQFQRLDGDLTAGEDRIELQRGSARFAVARDGTIDAGMPLHSLSTDGAAALTFRHDSERIEVRDADGSLTYEFRLP